MTMLTKPQLTRREFLIATAGVSIALVACSDDDDGSPTATASDAQPTTAATSAATSEATTAAGTSQTLPPTPACADDDDEPTIEQTEGPYFTPNSPERTSLRDAGMSGTPLVVAGRVLSTDCTPVERALVDFWQCDNDGMYDNEGYTLRGHQFTAADGTYNLETIQPGVYPGRTRHIHVKVQAPDNPVLTTQLYFPGEPGNDSDGIFDESLVVAVEDVTGGKSATFDFVLTLT